MMSDLVDTETPAERRHVRIKPWWLMAAAACLLGGVLLSLAAVDPVAYHWWQYERLRSRFSRTGYPTLWDNLEVTLFGNHWSRSDEHLQSLVDAGELERLSFHLSQRQHTQTEQNALLKFLGNGYRRGELVDFSVPSPSGKLGVTLKFECWCRPEHAEKWREFVRKYDAGE